MDAVETVVIGAGAAGLAAFQSLCVAGADAILIEARDRVGGRLWTLNPNDWPAPVELGAEFIHGAPSELNAAAVIEPVRRNWRRGPDGLLPIAEFGAGSDELFAGMARIEPPQPDCSFADFLRSHPDASEVARQQALGFIEGYEAADPERISVFSLNREWAAESEADTAEAPGPRRVRDGYGVWLESLAADGPVWLNTIVRTVRWRRGHVELDLVRNGEPARIEAEEAIVTLPLSVLQTDAVRFDPPLSGKRAALDGLIMGGALRVVLRLKSPLWDAVRDDAGNGMGELGFLFGTNGESGHLRTWWTAPTGRINAAQITGWAAGRHAWALAGRPTEFIVDRAVDDLAAALRLDRGVIETELIEAHTHDWQSDPYALGAYSYACVGGRDAPGELAVPIEDTLFFAGEATENAGHHATVQGAIRTGRRAAEEALRQPRTRRSA